MSFTDFTAALFAFSIYASIIFTLFWYLSFVFYKIFSNVSKFKMLLRKDDKKNE